MSETGAPFHHVQPSGVRTAQGGVLDTLPTKSVPGSSELPGRPAYLSAIPLVLLNLPKKALEDIYHRVLEPAGPKHLYH